MPRMLNRVTVIGRLVRDVESKVVGDTALAKCRIAISNDWKDKRSGEWQEDTTFIDVDVWGISGDHLASNAHQGDAILVDGELREDKWETDTGDKRSKIKIKAHRAELHQEKKGAGASAGGTGQASTPDTGYTDDSLPF